MNSAQLNNAGTLTRMLPLATVVFAGCTIFRTERNYLSAMQGTDTELTYVLFLLICEQEYLTFLFCFLLPICSVG
jgi:hypothetical protein